jgi:hypothetical protein
LELRVGQDVVDMNCSAFKCDPPGAGLSPRADRISIHEILVLTGNAEGNRQAIQITVQSIDLSMFGGAQSRSVFNKSLEYWLEVEG